MRFIVALVLFLPITTQAAVVISEVAWMGSAASANHEWIELYNDGPAIDVGGWTLTDGMNLQIALTGTIPAQSFAVLERTSDVSAAGTAFLIYTGSLVNTGATLQLKRSDGGLEDQVAGGENWVSIGGDNITKETAQYTSTGWVTGAATPGALNKGTPSVEPVDEEEDVEEPISNSTSTPNTPNTTIRKTSSGEAVKLTLPGMTLKLSVAAQKLGYVNQPIDFSVQPTGVGSAFINSLVYEWNFGDGTTAYVAEPTHSYQFPGTYVVTVYGGYKRQEQVARHEITILPVSLSLTTGAHGELQINNESPYEIDISGYRIDGGKRFVFPARSVMLPNQTISLKASQIGVVEQVVVRDSSGVIVTTKEKTKKADTPTVKTEPTKQIPKKDSSLQVKKSETVWHTPLVAPDTDTLGAIITSYLQPGKAEAAEDQTVASTTSKNPPIPQNAWPYLGLIGVILLGLFGTARKVLGNQSQ